MNKEEEKREIKEKSNKKGKRRGTENNKTRIVGFPFSCHFHACVHRVQKTAASQNLAYC
jgi:hypothetical protein